MNGGFDLTNGGFHLTNGGFDLTNGFLKRAKKGLFWAVFERIFRRKRGFFVSILTNPNLSKYNYGLVWVNLVS